MDIDKITVICKQLDHVTTDVKWEDHLCFNVGGKMFFIVSLTNIPTTSSFKTTESEFNNLIEQEGVIPAPYLARYKWVQVDNLNRYSVNKWTELIENSYKLVAAKLPKKFFRNKE